MDSDKTKSFSERLHEDPEWKKVKEKIDSKYGEGVSEKTINDMHKISEGQICTSLALKMLFEKYIKNVRDKSLNHSKDFFDGLIKRNFIGHKLCALVSKFHVLHTVSNGELELIIFAACIVYNILPDAADRKSVV